MRRGTRIARTKQGTDAVVQAGTSITVKPSGTTIDGDGINFGQGQVRFITGNTKLTDVSDGTKVLDLSASLSSLVFFDGMILTAGTTPTNMFIMGFPTTTGVTLGFRNTGASAGTSMAAKVSGSTLYYLAIGAAP